VVRRVQDGIIDFGADGVEGQLLAQPVHPVGQGLLAKGGTGKVKQTLTHLSKLLSISFSLLRA
jgi:hypothetical protein